MTTPTTKRKIIFDTDAGVDDSIALLTLLHSSTCQVVAVTTVDGNASLANCTANVRTLLAVDYARHGHIPIYPGARGPLIQSEEFQKMYWDGHGADGLGGARPFYEAEISDEIAKVKVVEDEHGANALVRMCKAEKGMTVVAIGPLTNIAMAIRLDPDFLSYIDKLYVMGGSLLAKGNATRTAEFNFACDPEAAHIVFTSSTKHSIQAPKIVLAPLELTFDHAFDWDLIERLSDPARHATFPWSKFLYRVTAAMRRMFRSPAQVQAVVQAKAAGITPVRHDVHVPPHHVGDGGRVDTCESYYLAICDSCATLPLAVPECVDRTVDHHVEIELAGAKTRGMMMLQWCEGADHRGLAKNCTVITHLKQDVIDKELERIFS
ncbi:Inosine/uridine-preferring nucleoside hydrolase domain-containing protein [Catenaria anguillulae PL171]|uniref:Inosine/uridine-preferring nucleoside hydrolase domain-containing protein n=1 Tax=Catenaria anguillulae PL171 TaxID=765915 RepID=A0A1Y2H9Y7_9FUNG|nr:Inosine/uridine-preferring nucleoside hydrolase domain-containing protein [Catenaria anguillulae PL171]